MFSYYVEKLKSVDYCAAGGAGVLVRIDINSPLGTKPKDS